MIGTDYRLTADGMVRFRDRIYVSNCNELKNLILREFHVKPYSGHPGYQDVDGGEEVLLLAKFEEGSGRIRG